MVNQPYFPLDLHLDSKMRFIEAAFGIKGFGVIVKLWMKIYATEGYYIEWTEDEGLLFADEIRVGYSLLSEIVAVALKRGIFDADMFDNYGILTSKGIQKRHFNMLKRHKEVTIKKQYLLVDVAPILKNVSILDENVNIQGENVNISKQIREDKNRIDENIAEESREAAAADPAITALRKYEQLIGLVTPTVIDDIDFYIKEGVESDLIIRLIEYACEQGKRTWAYIQASIRGNMDAGIKTLDGYNRAQAERVEAAKRVNVSEQKGKIKSKFNNYTDTNKPDYTNFGQKIIDDLLRESEG